MKDEAFKVDHANLQTLDLLSLFVSQSFDECKVTKTVRAIKFCNLRFQRS